MLRGMKHFCLPRLGRFHAVERSRGASSAERRGLPGIEGERENARCILRQRHFHPLPDNAHAHAVCSRIKGADGTWTRSYRVSTRDAPLRVALRTPSPDPRTHENACRLVYLAGGIYVRRSRNRSRNHERDVVLLDSRVAGSRV